MLTVHHLENSRSQRVLWLLEELGMEYEVKRYPRDPQTMLGPPELRAIHPLGKSPIVTDGDTVLAESGAILEYFVERSGGKLAPTRGTPEHVRYTYFMHYAEGSAMPPLLMKLVFERIKRGPVLMRPLLKGVADKVLSSFVHPQLRLHLDFLEDELAKRAWFAGDDFTAADIQMSFPLEAGAARAAKDVGGERPKIDAFLERIHARPAYQKALERGGPYTIG